MLKTTFGVVSALLLAGTAIGANETLDTNIALSSQPVAKPAADTAAASKATYGITDKRLVGSDEIGWPGFLNGLRGFEHFYNPIGNPLYFETPLNNTSIRALFLHHNFDGDSTLAGGEVNVYAVQARIAITERLGFIATKDGYSNISSGALGDAGGWNDIAAGLKYAFYVDKDADFIATGGFRYQMENGDKDVLMGGVQELSPFISLAKGFEKFHMMANLTDRVPISNGDDGNNTLQWDLHADYEVFDGLAPMIELHGLHYLDNGERTPLPVGGADYTNLGSTMVDDSSVIWLGVGARWKLTPHISVGADYEYPLTNRKADIFGDRVTVDLELTW